MQDRYYILEKLAQEFIEEPQKKKSKVGKYLLGGAAVGALGLGALGARYGFKNGMKFVDEAVATGQLAAKDAKAFTPELYGVTGGIMGAGVGAGAGAIVGAGTGAVANRLNKNN